ncbi:MAG: AmmeMemoRadiSam system radical SAM enzyme [Candidatus Micrarchaeota archaeon]|nr:AmmeMemoRadiSam system radical SAM enzyme [Candidatus Micrarchaeota archaeon]
MIREAGLYTDMGKGMIECRACARLCKLREGANGFCYVRRNVGGRLQLMNYGVLEAIQIDPIEKKPFSHFMPGSSVLGVGTSSCNWGCLFCQNHNISKDKEIQGEYFSPERIVGMALENNTQGIAFTYNEPTIFMEYAIDVARLAHREGLATMFVTNGYMTEEAVLAMRGNIDAAVVNIKGNAEQKFANRFEAVVSNEPIFESMAAMKRAGIHLEMTDLIIPRVGDSLEACGALTKRVVETLGPDVPMHFNAFHPDYKMMDYPVTDYATLKAHRDIAESNGVNYAYIGNAYGNPHENTVCPGCGGIAIGREGFSITSWNLDAWNRCNSCGTAVLMRGTVPKSFPERRIESLL